jgi:hypothetical protein
MTEKSPYPTKAIREACWRERDSLWKCLDDNNDDESKCKEVRKAMIASCPEQWVCLFFQFRHVLVVFVVQPVSLILMFRLQSIIRFHTMIDDVNICNLRKRSKREDMIRSKNMRKLMRTTRSRKEQVTEITGDCHPSPKPVSS